MGESAEINNLLNQPSATTSRLKKPAGQINFLDQKKSELLLQSIDNVMHKTGILLMMDCGLRVSEMVSLQIKNFDFRKQILTVKSLKKRGEDSSRQIPMSKRLVDTMAIYVSKLKPRDENSYLFPSTTEGGTPHVTRFTFNKILERLKKKHPSLNTLHPHALRHTFATKMLATGTKLHDLKEMLGHESYNTTLIYNHTPIEILRQNVENATAQKFTWYQKFWYRFFPKKSLQIINLSSNPQNFLIGRNKELEKLLDNIGKNINTILLGKIGIGKSHLLKQLDEKQAGKKY